ncbi:major facilitator superfamily domain-containing protein [Scheffersomyces xylosifermentans]|uniref:major facilitator superfamily domain-containing protein n=1 Tax=Scheffersomyces xylosifermentans TaxID=1304137 RepID=UPI00315D1F04
MAPKSKLTFSEQMKGFPARQMFIVCIIRFSEPLAFTSLFPYIYFMIRDFHIAEREQDISKYSGYLASSFAFCQFLFAVRWGKLSDKIGRKIILLIGLFGTSVSLICFGFSTNYWFALVSRSLAGVLNGNVAVLRTMIGEIATERRHQALAFSTLPLLFNFGSIIGPAIGGSKFLTHPRKENPYHPGEVLNVLEGTKSFYDKFIQKYPYALSNIVVAGFLWFSLVCGVLFLEETHEVHKYRRDYGVDLGDWLLSKVGISVPVRPWHKRNFTSASAQYDILPSEISPLLRDSISSPNADEASIQSETVGDDDDFSSEIQSVKPYISRRMSQAIVKTYSMSEHEVEIPNTPSYSNAFTPRVITVITGNFIISLHSVTYNEFLPVFLASRFQKDKLRFPFRIEGGFGLDVSYIGTLFSSTGIMGMLIILLIFPLIDRKLGTINGYRLSVSIFPLVYFLVPLSIFTLHDYNPNFAKWVTPVLLYSLTSLKTLASATGMPQVMLLNHRAAAKEHRAYVNSASMSIIALARCTGPIVFGYLMSIGDKIGTGELLWWVMSLLAGFGMIQSYWMEDREDDEDEKDSESESEDLIHAEAIGEEDLQRDYTTVEVSDEDTQTSISERVL